MATGDAAVLAGMSLVPGSGQAKDLDTYDNETRDYIATFWGRVWSGVRDKTTAPQVRTALGLGTAAIYDAQQSIISSSVPRRWSNGSLTGPTPGADGEYANKKYVDDTVAASSGVDATARATANAAKDGQLNAGVYSRVLSGFYRVAYIGADGLLGWVSSSRRYKKNIKPAVVDVGAVLSMELVTFLYKVEIDTARHAELQHGLIAEQLHDLGLTWLIDYGTDGQPEGVRYDRIALALLPAVQDLAARVTALEARCADQ